MIRGIYHLTLFPYQVKLNSDVTTPMEKKSEKNPQSGNSGLLRSVLRLSTSMQSS